MNMKIASCSISYSKTSLDAWCVANNEQDWVVQNRNKPIKTSLFSLRQAVQRASKS